MDIMRSFFWSDDVLLRKRRLLLCAALLLATSLWFALGAVLAPAPAQPNPQFLWGLLWIIGVIIALVFTRLLKTRQC